MVMMVENQIMVVIGKLVRKRNVKGSVKLKEPEKTCQYFINIEIMCGEGTCYHYILGLTEIMSKHLCN
jgi:hypothetical protein